MSMCIITGGSGFIGTHLIESIISANLFEKILVLDIKPPQIRAVNIEYVEVDVRSEICLDLEEGFDTCFHLAAVCKEPGYEWDEYFRTNHLGTVNVCAWLEKQNIKRLIFTSTMMVYRASENRNIENSLTSPDTGYGMSKLLAENVIECWGSVKQDREVVSIRLGVVFGRGENGNYTKLYRALAKKKFAYIGRKSTFKGSIYVKDTVHFLLLLSKKQWSYSVFNLVYDEPTTIEYICRTIQSVQGSKWFIPTIPYGAALLISYGFEFLNTIGISNNIHHRRIQKLNRSTNIDPKRAFDFGFSPVYSLESSIKDWARESKSKEIY